MGVVFLSYRRPRMVRLSQDRPIVNRWLIKTTTGTLAEHNMQPVDIYSVSMWGFNIIFVLNYR